MSKSIEPKYKPHIDSDNDNFPLIKKSIQQQNTRFDKHSINICTTFLDDLIEVTKGDSSIKFFRKDLITMIIWLFIIKSYANHKSINIEDIAREIAPASKISKPSLRLILENAKDKGFIKFTHSKIDNRSWVIEPEKITINEFKKWCEVFI
jgi:DNA-binding MarR family transcriptional regulator